MAAAILFAFVRGGFLSFRRGDAEAAATVPAQPLWRALRDPRVLGFLAVWFGVGTFRAAKTAGQPGIILRLLVASAILWVPSVAFWVFSELSALAYTLAGNA